MSKDLLSCILQSDILAVKMFRAIYGTRAKQYFSISNYIAQFRPAKSKLRFFHILIKFFSLEAFTMFLYHCRFQPLTQPHDP